MLLVIADIRCARKDKAEVNSSLRHDAFIKHAQMADFPSRPDVTGRVANHKSREVIAVDVKDEVMRVAEMFLFHPHRVFPVLDFTDVAGALDNGVCSRC